MNERKRGSITIRVGMSFIDHIDTMIDTKKFNGISDCVNHYIKLGQELDALLQIFNDPKKRQEFDAKFNALVTEKNVEQTLETMDRDHLRAIIFFAQNQLDKKTRQELLNIQKYS